MGFWGSVGKIISGKPVFEIPPAERNSDWDDDKPVIDYAEEKREKQKEIENLYDDNGQKVIPTVKVDHVKYTQSGDKIEVWATIHNYSDRPIFLDKIALCNQVRELNYPLVGGAERELSVYKGLLLNHDSYKKAELYYRDEGSGDYFRADHVVEYHFDAQTNTYAVNSLELINPIRDI